MVLWISCLHFSVVKSQTLDTLYGHMAEFDGNVLIGGNIVKKGIWEGAVSDIDGMYKLPISGDLIDLTYSYDGYRPLDVNVKGYYKVDVIMKWYGKFDVKKKHWEQKWTPEWVKKRVVQDFKRYPGQFLYYGVARNHLNQPLPNVKISISDTDKIIQADEKGRFLIAIKEKRHIGLVLIYPMAYFSNGEDESKAMPPLIVDLEKGK